MGHCSDCFSEQAIGFSYWSMSTMYLNAGAMVTDILVSTVVMAIIGPGHCPGLGQGKIRPAGGKEETPDQDLVRGYLFQGI